MARENAPVRHFLSWEAPLLPQAVGWLVAGWNGQAPLDLSGTLVVVPTRQAGRRLRSALASRAAEHGQAVFPPGVVTPEALVAPVPAAAAATAFESQLAWAEVLGRVNLGELRPLFPVDPPVRNFAWAWRVASDFAKLQATLAEAGLQFGDVAQRLGDDFPEQERWACISALGRHHAEVLARLKKSNPQSARLRMAQAPALPSGVIRIVMVAVPDPLPLALRALEELGRQVPVHVLVAAPQSEADNFDSWGCPRVEAWTRREPPFADFTDEVHLLPDAAAQAEQIAALARRIPEPDGVLGVAIADAEIAPLAENALERAGCAAFNPAGEFQRAHGFHQFLSALAAFGREATFANVIALARTPEVLDWLAVELRGSFSAAGWLAGLDELHARHLPANLGQARGQATGVVQRGLALLDELRQLIRANEFAPGAAAALGRVFAARRLDLARSGDRRLEESANVWSEVVRECASAQRHFPQAGRDDWWELAVHRFGEQPRELDKPAGAIELQGWLELPFEDAPHVVVAGFNEGRVPESIVGDVFLPESARVRLGLKGNAARFARDAYLLHALVASRRAAGRVDILLGKVNAQGEPVRPSRLLLQCADAALPKRIEHLFSQLESQAALPAWERPWKLQPPRRPVPPRVSVTAFRAYLECPFRFYLRHVLRLSEIDPHKNELDALDFGTLCHAPLELLAAPEWCDCTDETALGQALIAEFDRLALHQFGPAPTVPIVAQLESGRQRLRRAAQVQVRQRAEGWRVVAKERKFQLRIAGLEIHGKIDRIDRHEQTGAWRVIDYKTSDSAKHPRTAHLGPVRDETPEWAVFPGGNGRPSAWVDLQLPLYVHALPLEFPEANGPIGCGYFNLPKAIASAALTTWEDYTPELHESALRCAAAVAAAVQAEQFWPPSARVRPDYDTFGELFHRGAAESIEWPRGGVEVAP